MTTQVASASVKDAPAGTGKWVYDFGEGSREMRDLLGRQGRRRGRDDAHPRPGPGPGRVHDHDRGLRGLHAGGAWPAGLQEQVSAALSALEKRAGKRLGDAEDPLLVSVRSGARESMPGMMDSVLNLGLNDELAVGLAARTGEERFAWDCYRRLVQMFGNVVRGIPGERFEDEIARVKRERGVTLDTELDAEALRELTASFRSVLRLPHRPTAAADQAIQAVFDSWMGERAVQYRRINRLPDDWGTAVNVQQMVYGNQGETRAPGWPSAATRSPVRRRRRATSCRAPRARTSCPASARRATSPSCASGCRRPPRS